MPASPVAGSTSATATSRCRSRSSSGTPRPMGAASTRAWMPRRRPPPTIGGAAAPGPGAAPCDTATTSGGALVTSPWYRDLLSATTSPLVTNQSTSLTASFLTDSAGAAVSAADLAEIVGRSVTWAATHGTLSSTQGSVQAAGTATGSFQATSPEPPSSPRRWTTTTPRRPAPTCSASPSTRQARPLRSRTRRRCRAPHR